MTVAEASENHTTIADLGRDEVRAAAAEVGLRLNLDPWRLRRP
ncbi:hypothetical protein [Rhodococcus sp. ACPA1]|nr:hypothetical protein [Rhodococcus sp. ACPA1]